MGFPKHFLLHPFHAGSLSVTGSEQKASRPNNTSSHSMESLHTSNIHKPCIYIISKQVFGCLWSYFMLYNFADLQRQSKSPTKGSSSSLQVFCFWLLARPFNCQSLSFNFLSHLSLGVYLLDAYNRCKIHPDLLYFPRGTPFGLRPITHWK